MAQAEYYIIIRLLLHIQVLELCSLMIKVQRINAHGPSLALSGTLTQSSRPSIRIVFVGNKDWSIQDWSRVHQYYYKF